MDFIAFKKRFTFQRLANLFLVSAFPFHLWVIIMLLNDYSWITERSGVDSFVGVASLAMVYAFVESVILFALLLVVSLLLPWKWTGERVFTVLGFVALWTPIWDMLNQVMRHTEINSPAFITMWLFSTGHPVRYGYILLAAVVLVVVTTTAAGIWLTSFNQKFRQWAHSFLDRITLLSALYLVLDVVGLVIIIIRVQG
jgi:hypothetical protein